MGRIAPLALLFAGLGAGLMLARVLWQGEPINPRTLTLMTMAGLSAGLAAALVAPLAHRRTRWFWRLLAAGSFCALFMAVMTGLYVFEHVIIAQHYEGREDRDLAFHLMNYLRTGGLFLASAPTYLLPWQLPLLAALAGWLLPGKTKLGS